MRYKNGSEIRCIVSPCVEELNGKRDHSIHLSSRSRVCRLEAASPCDPATRSCCGSSLPPPLTISRLRHAALVMLEHRPPPVRALGHLVPGHALAGMSGDRPAAARDQAGQLALPAAGLPLPICTRWHAARARNAREALTRWSVRPSTQGSSSAAYCTASCANGRVGSAACYGDTGRHTHSWSAASSVRLESW